jgi:pimeloyl-ACP methyl ester carboxylesterase
MMPWTSAKDGTRLHYQCVGEGEDLVLIHGLGANLAFWYLGVARPLARSYRVITYDLRGHGRSEMPERGYDLTTMASDLYCLLDHLGVNDAHIVGHSFGARVALCFSTLHPDRVKSVTVADTQISSLHPQIRLADWQYWPKWKEQLTLQGVKTFPDDSEFINFQMLAHFNQLTQDFTQGALNQPQRSRRPSLKSRDMGSKGADRWNQLLQTTSASKEFALDGELSKEHTRQLGMPTLALFGEYSHCMECCRQLNQLVDTCRVKIMPGAGHFLPAVKPRLFTQILSDFLQDINTLVRPHRKTDSGYPEKLDRRVEERRSLQPSAVAYPFVDETGYGLVMFDRRKLSAFSVAVQESAMALDSQEMQAVIAPL